MNTDEYFREKHYVSFMSHFGHDKCVYKCAKIH